MRDLDIPNVFSLIEPAHEHLLEEVVRTRATGTRTHHEARKKVVPEGQRDEWLFRRSCAMRAAGMDYDEILAAATALNATRIKPPLPQRVVEKCARQAAGYDRGSEHDVDSPDSFFAKNGTDLATLHEVEFDPIVWAVHPILPAGLSILAGRPKAAKSWFAFDLCISIAAGADVLNRYPTEEGDALYIALEDSMRRLQSRARTMLGRSASHPGRCSVFTTWPKLHEGGEQLLAEWIVQKPKTRLIVIDTLAKIRRPPRSNANVYQEDYAALERLQKLAISQNVAILVVHHTRKTEGATDPFDAISGSTGLTGCADTLWMLTRTRNEPTGELLITGREVTEEKFSMRLDEKHMRWQCLGEAATIELSQVRTEILATLAKDPMTPKDLAEHLDRPRPATRKLLMSMRSDGLVKRERDDRYSVTAVGLQDLKRCPF